MIVIIRDASWLGIDWGAVAAIAALVSGAAAVGLLILASSQLKHAVEEFNATQDALRRQAEASAAALRAQVRPQIAVEFERNLAPGAIHSSFTFKGTRRGVLLSNFGMGPGLDVRLEIWPGQGHVSNLSEVIDDLGTAPIRSHGVQLGPGQHARPTLDISNWPQSISSIYWRVTYSDVTDGSDPMSGVGQVH